MIWFRNGEDAQRFPLGATLISVLAAGNIGSAVLMLLAQG
jgi:hypothetical protein